MMAGSFDCLDISQSYTAMATTTADALIASCSMKTADVRSTRSSSPKRQNHHVFERSLPFTCRMSVSHCADSECMRTSWERVVPMARCVLMASASMYTGTGLALPNGSAGAHLGISVMSSPVSRPWSCTHQQAVTPHFKQRKHGNNPPPTTTKPSGLSMLICESLTVCTSSLNIQPRE